MWHARRCLELAEAATAGGVADDWDVAAALEGIARALEGIARAQLAVGDRAGAAATLARARETLTSIADPKDRHLIEQDVSSLSS